MSEIKVHYPTNVVIDWKKMKFVPWWNEANKQAFNKLAKWKNAKYDNVEYIWTIIFPKDQILTSLNKEVIMVCTNEDELNLAIQIKEILLLWAKKWEEYLNTQRNSINKVFAWVIITPC